MKANENPIHVVAESVVLTENISTCKWVLNSLTEMEHKSQLSKLRIVFADELITQSLLEQLNISGMCTLRCDY